MKKKPVEPDPTRPQAPDDVGGVAPPSPGSGPEAAPEGAPAAAVPPGDDLARRVAEAAGLAAQVASLEDKVKRLQAEFLNETKRIRAQAESDGQFAIQRVVVDLLPLTDALHGAAGTTVETPEGRRLREGIDLLVKQLDDVLARHGVMRIEAAGRPFDPAVHEALMLVDRADLPPQVVVDVVRPGFTLHGRVVRPAHVTVSKAPAPPTPPTPDAPAGGDTAPGKGR